MWLKGSCRQEIHTAGWDKPSSLRPALSFPTCLCPATDTFFLHRLLLSYNLSDKKHAMMKLHQTHWCLVLFHHLFNMWKKERRTNLSQITFPSPLFITSTVGEVWERKRKWVWHVIIVLERKRYGFQSDTELWNTQRGILCTTETALSQQLSTGIDVSLCWQGVLLKKGGTERGIKSLAWMEVVQSNGKSAK